MLASQYVRKGLKLHLTNLTATLTGPATPVAVALSSDPEELLARAERMAAALAVESVPCEAVRSEAAVGGGGAPGVVLPSAALCVDASLATPLRTGSTPVVGRVHEGRLLLDLVAVPADRDDALVTAVLTASTGLLTRTGEDA